jgi:hypothetical protein
VRAMPGASYAADWLNKANKAIEVHRALDSLSQSALAPPMLPPATPNSMPSMSAPNPSPAVPATGQ